MQAAQESYKPYTYKSYSYNRNAVYDHDLRPDVKIEPIKKIIPVKKEKVAPIWDKLNIMLVLILSGLLSIGYVVSSVYANEIQRSINRTVISTQDISVEIGELVVKINEGLDISTIEKRAVEELGMVYPVAKQFVHLEEYPVIIDFAQYIRESTYDPFDDPPLVPVCRYEETGGTVSDIMRN